MVSCRRALPRVGAAPAVIPAGTPSTPALGPVTERSPGSSARGVRCRGAQAPRRLAGPQAGELRPARPGPGWHCPLRPVGPRQRRPDRRLTPSSCPCPPRGHAGSAVFPPLASENGQSQAGRPAPSLQAGSGPPPSVTCSAGPCPGSVPQGQGRGGESAGSVRRRQREGGEPPGGGPAASLGRRRGVRSGLGPVPPRGGEQGWSPDHRSARPQAWGSLLASALQGPPS